MRGIFRRYSGFWSLVWFFILCAGFSQSLRAAEPPIIKLDPAGSTQLIQNKLRQYIGDPQGKLSPQEVRAKSEQFIATYELNDHLGELTLPHIYWLRFKVFNPTDQVQTRTLAFEQHIFKAELYCAGAKRMEPQEAGPYVAPRDRPFPFERVAFRVELAPQETIDCLIKSFPLYGQVFEVALQPHHDFGKRLQTDLLFFALFYGAAFLLALYHVLIYFTLNEKALLLYAAMIGSVATFLFMRDGLPHLFFETDERWSWPLVWSTFLLPIWLNLLLRYGRELTGLAEQFPRFKRVYLGFEWFVLLPILVAPFAIVQAAFLDNLMMLLTFLLLLPSTAWQWHKGNRLAGWFAITLGLHLTGTMFEMLRMQAVVPSNAYTRYVMFGMMFLEFILLAWVMSRRFNRKLVGMVEQRTDELNEAIRVKDKFFAIIAHDLRGPIGSLLVVLQLAQEGVMKFDKTLLNSSVRTLDDIRQLLNDLLDWATHQQGRIEPQVTTFSLREPAQAALELQFPAAEQKQITLSGQLDPEAYVMADCSMITTAIRNLVSNAVKFTKDGKVALNSRVEDDRVVFEVIDTGIGISEERLPLLFDLKRGTKGSKGTGGETGSGLGLLLVREFIEANGGQVGVSSQVGVGSRFWFSLPRAEAPLKEPEPVRALPEGLQVLVVEDDPLHLKACEHTLNQMGLNYDIARDGEEAIERAGRTNYDVILMDIDLPKVSGVEATKAILRLDQKVKIIAATGYDQAELEQRFGTAPFDGYLHKPLEEERLLPMLKRLLGEE